jgi:hypothetical protein
MKSLYGNQFDLIKKFVEMYLIQWNYTHFSEFITHLHGV